ncbi:YggT family protein [bacterium]|nr:MAG: YggT family protein [bacterium]RKZ13823.1 MAG: YggT family protein [bacterium]
MIADLLLRLIDLYALVILVRVVLSWLPVDHDQPWVRFVVDVTEPVVGPIRRVLPSFGGLDFSPLVAMLLLQLMRNMLAGR